MQDHIKYEDCEKVASSFLDARKKGNCPVQLEEVLPANRATLNMNKIFSGASWTPKDTFFNRKKLLIPGVSNVLKKCEIVDFADDVSFVNRPSNEVVALSSNKKRKVLPSSVLNTGNFSEVSADSRNPRPDSSFTCSCSGEPVESPFDSNCQNSHPAVVLSSVADANMPSTSTDTVLQKDTIEPLSVPKKDEETKGAAFLMQVYLTLGSKSIVNGLLLPYF